MGYAKKLKQQYTGLDALSGYELQRRRDALSKAGVLQKPQGSGFSTNVRSIGNKTDTKINSYFRSKFHSPRGVK